MECSNKGTCNRATGECECYEGYDGSACQRASCPGYPNSCSGHGVCKTISQLAKADNNNEYNLWDKDSTMGCECDYGYFGPDCSQKACKYGVDPLYTDDVSVVKKSSFFFNIFAADKDFIRTSSALEPHGGLFSIRFFDIHGQPWLSDPIPFNSDCDDITNALYSIPNNVIPADSIVCEKITSYNMEFELPSSSNKIRYNTQFIYPSLLTSSTPSSLNDIFNVYPNSFTDSQSQVDSIPVKYSFYLEFTGNPGSLPEPEIVPYVYGETSTLFNSDVKSTAQVTFFDNDVVIPVAAKVHSDGGLGENKDLVADYCHGLKVKFDYSSSEFFLVPYIKVNNNWVTNDDAISAFKTCLGTVDFDENTVGLEHWDLPGSDYLHLVKVVNADKAFSQYFPISEFKSATKQFFVSNSPYAFYNQLDNQLYDLYTTKGVLYKISSGPIHSTLGSKKIYSQNSIPVCESTRDAGVVPTCVGKNDIVTFFTEDFTQNPSLLNLYTIQKIDNSLKKYIGGAFESYTEITLDYSSNFAYNANIGSNQPNLYVFIPNVESTYHVTAECANRGICNRDSGVCECFSGYTTDNCSVQNSLSF